MKYFDKIMVKNLTLSLFLAAGFLGITVIHPLHNAYAAVYEFCQPDQTLYEKIQGAFQSLDIRRTTNNMIFSAVTDSTFYMATGRNATQNMACSKWLLKGNPQFAALYDDINSHCPSLPDDSNCADIVQTYGSASLINGRAFNQTQVSGSLLGLTNYVEGASVNEPIPVNLAYYWNDTIKDVPFAGTALAAEVQYGNAPFISFIYQIWEMTRNVSLGILAVIMMVIGISIMMRKRLSPQLVVTAQYALPRVALAVILIMLSYPIGAVLASSMRYLLSLTNGLVFNALMSGGGIHPNIGMAVGIFLALTFSAAGVGAVLAVFMVLFIVAAILLYLFVLIKAAMLYIKLIFSIVFAPIIFALGAIPGNEMVTTKWFKSAISNVLGFAFSIGYAHLVLAILFLAASNGQKPDAGLGAQVGSFFIIVFFPVFTVYGFIQASKVPGQIQNFIMGEEKRPGGRK